MSPEEQFEEAWKPFAHNGEVIKQIAKAFYYEGRLDVRMEFLQAAAERLKAPKSQMPSSLAPFI